MYSLNFDLIRSPRFVEGSNHNEISGLLADAHGNPTVPVRVRRCLVGWEARIRIAVNGVQLHDAEATAQERNDFASLGDRAYVEQDDEFTAKRIAARAASKALFAPAGGVK